MGPLALHISPFFCRQITPSHTPHRVSIPVPRTRLCPVREHTEGIFLQGKLRISNLFRSPPYLDNLQHRNHPEVDDLQPLSQRGRKDFQHFTAERFFSSAVPQGFLCWLCVNALFTNKHCSTVLEESLQFP